MIPISIIVPIYNMEAFIRRCLDSILVQSFKEYECLLIDDGSSDGSPGICDEYAAKDSRFIVLHKANGGLSDARNYGLERVQGEYTIFFDPDDWVEEKCLEEMYAKAKEGDFDMVICDYYNDDSYRSLYTKQTPSSLTHTVVLEDIITGKLYGFTWNKLLKRTLYTQYNLNYPVGMYGCEDQYTMCKLLKNDIKIAYLPQAYYHYVFYSYSSASRHYEQSTFEMDLKVRSMFVQLFEDEHMQQLAYQHKTTYLVSRAFKYGQGVFSSKSFRDSFVDYKEIVIEGTDNCLDRFFLTLAFAGFYCTSRKIWGGAFRVKQFYKKIIYSFIKGL